MRFCAAQGPTSAHREPRLENDDGDDDDDDQIMVPKVLVVETMIEASKAPLARYAKAWGFEVETVRSMSEAQDRVCASSDST